MASIADKLPHPRSARAPTAFDYLLALGAVTMLAAVCAALIRGRAEWGLLPGIVWFHLATIGLALALSPVMLLRRRGDRWHRRLGYVWVGAMAITALASFNMRFINDGGFSWIHLLSLLSLGMCFLLVREARRHNVRAHLSTVRGIVVGALLIAGFFTFPFDRLLGRWLQGLPALG